MVKNLWTALVGFVRANFYAGVFIAVPFTITIAFLVWLWNRMQQPLARVFQIASGPDETAWSNILAAVESSDYSKLFIPIISLFFIFIVVLILGIIARSIIGRMLLLGVEKMVAQVPVVGVLYISLKQLGEAFGGSDARTRFESAVAIQFPYKGCWAIGFVTGRAAAFMPLGIAPNPERHKELLSVFVPTTPLPTQGFMLVVPDTEVVKLEMPVADALKLVVSGGIISPGDSHRIKSESEITRIIRRQTRDGVVSNSDKDIKPPSAKRLES
jgi:uncharacterized membrane protein